MSDAIPLVDAAHPHAVRFADALFHALPERGLWWPAQRALLVADLHLEKASYFAGHGQMLPPFDSEATLDRLSALVDRLNPRSIWALGDSFHDAHGPARLPPRAEATLARLCRGRDMVWIVGNHDHAAALPGDAVSEAMLGGIILRHEAVPDETQPEISGHFHPKMRAGGIRRPCFVHDRRRMILPSFGALTGGLDVEHPAIRALLADSTTAIIATGERACRFALPPSEQGQRRGHRSAKFVARMSHMAE